ncbi:hypothetical protein GCM10023116_46640 [Kistimonas scapharcae]|uniref:Peptidase M15A C-terminal domain-containing protein n=2 Tax=Kistimonas scapharcae TaxID=1036133 RepID=A0ABP8V8Q9_9GAMM
MDAGLLVHLDQARKIAGVPFTVTSAVRCEAHNTNVGGSPTSSHIKGYAVDIAARDDHQREQIVRGLVNAGFRRIGIAKTFVHVDVDPDKRSAMWVY